MHIIITNYVFDTSEDAKAVSTAIYDRLPVSAQSAFDKGVNNKTQHFRTPGSTKDGRMLEIPEGYTREQLMITACTKLPRIRISKRKAKKQQVILDADINKILTAAAEHIVGWNFRIRSGNTLIFNRTPIAKTYCDICKRDHTKDNTLRLYITPQGVYRRCIRNLSKSICVITYQNRLETIIAEELTEDQFNTNFKFDYQDKYNEPLVRPITMHKTIYMKANMKMGKTNAAMAFMTKGFGSILVLSSRKTFTADKLNAFEPYGFRSYSDIEGEIDLNRTPRVIMQVESLHRLRQHKLPTLLLIDESESIFEQFMSPTMRKVRECMVMFEWLLKGAGCVLAMDANLGATTIDITRKWRGIDDEYLIVNEYKNMTGDHIWITEDKDSLNHKLLEHITNGKNIIVPTNSKRYADTIYKLIIQKIDPSKVLLITSETSDDDKKRIFGNVNAEWRKYQVVIFTPTCSAGVSFTEKHFDAVFGYFINKSTNVEAWRQAMYRARDIASRNYYICADCKTSYNHITDVNEMKEHIKYADNINRSKIEMLNYDYQNGEYQYSQNLMYDIYVYGRINRSRSKCRPIETFVEQCKRTGAQFHILPVPPSGELRKEYVEMAKKVKDDQQAVIAETADISPEQYEELIEKAVKTTADNQVIERHMLRKTYNYYGAIDKPFVDVYNDPAHQRTYKNLTEILQKKTLSESLAEIQINYSLYEKPITNYTNHKIAIDLLLVCGYTSITDPTIIMRDKLLANILAKKELLEKDMGAICVVFDDKRKLTGWKFRSILDFLNGIFHLMYGLKICAVSNAYGDRNRFRLKHYDYGVIFNRVASENKPFIIEGWRDCAGGFTDDQ